MNRQRGLIQVVNLDLQSIAESFVQEAGIQLVILPPFPVFHQVLILKMVKVLCFEALL